MINDDHVTYRWEKWNIIQLIASVNENDMAIIGGDLNEHVGKGIDGYDGVHGGYGFGLMNTKGDIF